MLTEIEDMFNYLWFKLILDLLFTKKSTVQTGYLHDSSAV